MIHFSEKMLLHQEGYLPAYLTRSKEHWLRVDGSVEFDELCQWMTQVIQRQTTDIFLRTVSAICLLDIEATLHDAVSYCTFDDPFNKLGSIWQHFQSWWQVFLYPTRLPIICWCNKRSSSNHAKVAKIRIVWFCLTMPRKNAMFLLWLLTPLFSLTCYRNYSAAINWQARHYWFLRPPTIRTVRRL